MRRAVVDIAEAIVPTATMMSLRVRRALRGGRDEELKILPLLRRGGAFIDVGANIGLWTGPAARCFRQVHAFEPDALIADTLRRIAPANVVVHEIALSDHDGVGQFRIPIYRGRPVRTRSSLESDANLGCDEMIYEVRLNTLDGLNLRGIDAIKIDVEGHEGAVLAGAITTIDRERPTLVVEIENRHNASKSEDVIGGVLDRGYRCYYIRSGRMLEFRSGSIGDLQPFELIPAPGDRKKATAYINNFIFIPRERSDDVAMFDDFLQRSSGKG